MNTYEISREELANEKPVVYGYKAIAWDGGTQRAFRYGAEAGENLIGRVWKVDGGIKECSWGLHFSEDPAYVFNFYEPLGYNRYFKVAAYGDVIKNDYKSVASTLEFVEEYNLIEYINIIKRYDRSSTAVSNSTAVSDSNAVCCSTAVGNSTAVGYSNAVSNSTAVSDSAAVSNSDAVCNSTAVGYSTAVNNSNAVSYSFGIRNCCGAFESLFCAGKNGICRYIFNKKSTKKRVDEITKNLKKFGWVPSFSNWYDIKGDKAWWAFCFPQLRCVTNADVWARIPAEMLEYIKSLPEFDEAVWKKITE